MAKANKARVFIRRWAVERKDEGLVNFTSSPYTITGLLAQMRYKEFLWIFGIPLSHEVVYELQAHGTAKPHVRKTKARKAAEKKVIR